MEIVVSDDVNGEILSEGTEGALDEAAELNEQAQLEEVQKIEFKDVKNDQSTVDCDEKE